MIHDILAVAAGLVLLLIGGDTLVRGAVSLSLRLGIPALIVSLTVVAFGTSAPELLIAVQSALEGAPGIGLGNVVGSNIANVLLVLGLPALITPIHPAEADSRRTYRFMIGASIVATVLCFLGPLDIWHGAILFGLFLWLIWDAIHTARTARRAARTPTAEDLSELEDADPQMPIWKLAAYLIGGLIALPVGADLLVDGAVGIADQFHVDEAVIGLTIVAIGTSLPELATSVMAALRRQADVAIGNVIGSNMFNILGILGIASFFGPLAVPDDFLRLDLWVMIASALILWPFVFSGWAMTRIWGVFFLGLYLLYLVMVVV